MSDSDKINTDNEKIENTSNSINKETTNTLIENNDNKNTDEEELNKEIINEKNDDTESIENKVKSINLNENKELKNDDIMSKRMSNQNTSVINDNNSHTKEIVYCVKWIEFNNKSLPIILQNENGPCPLLAIANILLLKQVIKLNTNTEYLTSKSLFNYLGDALFKFKPMNLKPEDELNFNQNFDDALNLLNKLQFGLDVNVKFTDVNKFEYTTELNIFDMFNINLYHGWLVDPQQIEILSIIDNLSYNQLVEKIIYLKNSDSQVDYAQAIQVEEFLDSTQTQLTYHGLIMLQQALKPNELAVFFRNNHFSTIYKHKDNLYLLVTDQGFLQSRQIVWETLSNIDGDIYYVNSNFRLIQESNETGLLPLPTKNVDDYNNDIEFSENDDYAIAKKLQDEMDENYASLIHEEEKRKIQLEEQQYRQQQQRQLQMQHEQEQKKKKKKDSCSIM